jgi:hypothetical protein
MGQLGVNQNFLNNPDTAGLLPVEIEVEGVMKAREYMFEITSAVQLNFKTGGQGLKCQFATSYRGNRLYADELFSYDPNFISRFAKLVNMLGIKIDGISEEDFPGRFFWATIRHESFDTKEIGPDGLAVKATRNKVNQFLRQATEEEVTGASGEVSQEPPF